ncbi:unnamed protein product [Rotaria sp. Silwood1]|nr:unnamed protein product [Rotaria sp. Silwood1]CAF3441626.1 unnamed protein product [Rotaria sp. Silwood1]CAF4782970.1 unnamed protein product [Rotaria sp. Silwood1]
MLSAERQSTRSPTTSQTDSYGTGIASRANGRPYQQRSSITGENERQDDEYGTAPDDMDEQERTYRPPPRNEDPYLSALKIRFPNRPRGDYAYTRPTGPLNPSVPPAPPLPSASTTQPITTATSGSTTIPRTEPYQSTIRPISGSTNILDGSDDRTIPRPALRRVNPEQQNTYARRIASEITTPTSSSKPISSSGVNVRITDPTIDTNQLIPSTFTQQSGIPRINESIFETVPSHGGPVSYLGIGTFSQLEQCLRECLERERRQIGITSQITRYDIPPNISVNDYGYSSAVASPPPQEFYPSSNPYLIDYPSRSTPTLLLDDIRHINVALSRSGISLFPYERFSPESFCYPESIPIPSTTIHSTHPTERRSFGEVVSACRFVEEDSELLYDRNRYQAVQNVWNTPQNYPPFSNIDASMSNVYPRGPYDI